MVLPILHLFEANRSFCAHCVWVRCVCVWQRPGTKYRKSEILENKTRRAALKSFVLDRHLWTYEYRYVLTTKSTAITFPITKKSLRINCRVVAEETKISSSLFQTVATLDQGAASGKVSFLGCFLKCRSCFSKGTFSPGKDKNFLAEIGINFWSRERDFFIGCQSVCVYTPQFP